MDKDGDLDGTDLSIIVKILSDYYGKSGWPFIYILRRSAE